MALRYRAGERAALSDRSLWTQPSRLRIPAPHRVAPAGQVQHDGQWADVLESRREYGAEYHCSSHAQRSGFRHMYARDRRGVELTSALFPH